MSLQSASEYCKLMKVSSGSGFGGLLKHPHSYQYLFRVAGVWAGCFLKTNSARVREAVEILRAGCNSLVQPLQSSQLVHLNG